MDKEAVTKLKEHKINITKPRIVILKAFLETVSGLDYNYFYNVPMFNMNKATIFRTFNLFVTRKIIYRIPAIDGLSRYLLQENSQSQSPVDHSSFVCTNCGSVTPLITKSPPEINLPKGYKVKNLEIVMSGLCKSCKQ